MTTSQPPGDLPEPAVTEPDPTATGSAPPSEHARPEPEHVPRTRTSSTFIALLAGAVVLVLLLIFILENTQRAKITYFGATGHLPLGVALLCAAVAGAVVMGVVGSARIAQLRRRVKRRRR